MDFLDRAQEMERLDRLAKSPRGGLAVVFGRRRIGKTRLLLEWSRKHGGLYTVADRSSPGIQRQYLAEAVAARLPGFADVTYPDWRGLLSRLARDAAQVGWRGPVTLDELPYLIQVAPELPSVLQAWIDHEAKDARLVVALAGSSQRMMQGLVLDSAEPLFGRAAEVLEVGPLGPEHAAHIARPRGRLAPVEWYAAWGGIPRYWELASDAPGTLAARIDRLVLDPMGALHDEPDRLLLEELPPAVEVRPVLDAIGAGAHRLSEIAGRIGRPATALAHPVERLRGMGLVRREIPYGESERSGKRSLYRIDDPFLRLWFRVVAPRRAALARGTPATRGALLALHWPQLVAEAWEELCRDRLPGLDRSTRVGRLGPWGPAGRWWWKSAPEWDVVAESADGRRLLVGEAWWCAKQPAARALARAADELRGRALPEIGRSHAEVVRVLFIPDAPATTALEGVNVVIARDLLRGRSEAS